MQATDPMPQRGNVTYIVYILKIEFTCWDIFNDLFIIITDLFHRVTAYDVLPPPLPIKGSKLRIPVNNDTEIDENVIISRMFVACLCFKC